MSLPTALQKQLEEAKQQLEPQNEVNEPKAPEQVQQLPEERAAEQIQPTEAPLPTAQEEQPAQVIENTTPAPDDQNNDTWKHKFDVLDGKYRAETRRLHDENKALKQQLEDAKKQVQAPQPQIQPQPVNSKQLTDEEVIAQVGQDMVDDYGMEYWKKLLNAQKMNSQPAPAQVDDSRIKSIEQSLTQQRQNQFYGELDKFVPNWETINQSPEWQKFLDTPEPLSGQSYDDLLQSAAGQYDSLRVAKVFETFTSLKNNGGTKKPSIDNQVMPSSSTVIPQDQGGPTMTMNEWVAKMNALAQSGLSPMEMASQREKLKKLMTDGRVSQPGQPPANTSFV